MIDRIQVQVAAQLERDKESNRKAKKQALELAKYKSDTASLREGLSYAMVVAVWAVVSESDNGTTTSSFQMQRRVRWQERS